MERVEEREALRAMRPPGMMEYLLKNADEEMMYTVGVDLARMTLGRDPKAIVKVRFADDQAVDLMAMAREIVSQDKGEGGGARAFVRSIVVTGGALGGEEVQSLREKLLMDFAGRVFTSEAPKERPVRGPHGEATIVLKPGTEPVKQRPFQIHGERGDALKGLIAKLIEEGKLEQGVSAWSSPAFPVPKKTPGQYRLVVDFRALNDATVNDAHPLPRIEDILQRQGQYKVWSVLDMKDGYHQIPLRKSDRPLTCMSTPLGSYQWTVLVMGLKNGGSIFQRVMEHVLQGMEGVDIYIDDVIVGTTATTMEGAVKLHDAKLREVCEKLAEYQLIVDPKKVTLFATEVEFCGHVLREGTRSPAPGKLLSIQKWELPRTITQLRGFLGLTNYYSSYVSHYADYAGPLMAKLQVNRIDGKKGSTKPLVWKAEEKVSFERLKRELTQSLELFRVNPDEPFSMRTDASDRAIGAVLEQEQMVGEEMKCVPVGFFSRKLGKSQLNWAPREKETYAIVSALRKWAGWIGMQPITVHTDHRSLEHWVHEKMDTPSGPAGRRARWHETMSKFNLTVQYLPGKDNIVADGLSRYAYPAAGAFQDTSFHGSEEARKEMKAIIEVERREAKGGRGGCNGRGGW